MVGRGGCSGLLCGRRCDGRMRALRGTAAAGPGRAKAPPTRGRRGLGLIDIIYSSSSRVDTSWDSGSKSKHPLGTVNTRPSGAMICSVSI